MLVLARLPEMPMPALSREAGGSGREDGASQPSGAPSSGPSDVPPNALLPARIAEPAGLGEVAVAGAEEDEMMADVAALAGGGSGDALATLEGALRPIERYAVRLVEEARLRMSHSQAGHLRVNIDR